ncbi:hypothetical protein CCP2SC5_440002 [Azospirillaceae bacterium]
MPSTTPAIHQRRRACQQYAELMSGVLMVGLTRLGTAIEANRIQLFHQWPLTSERAENNDKGSIAFMSRK